MTNEIAETTTIGVVFQNELFKRLEGERERREALAGVSISRSSFMRALLDERLKQIEAAE